MDDFYSNEEMNDDTETESTDDETTEDAIFFNEEATTCSDFHRITNPYFEQD